MPYELSWEPLGVVIRYSGVVSDEDIIASVDETYASPRLLVIKYQISDFSRIETADVSSETVRKIADLDIRVSEANPDLKVAVITSAPFVRGMSNMYAINHEVRGGSWTTKIFEREEDARAWAAPSS